MALGSNNNKSCVARTITLIYVPPHKLLYYCCSDVSRLRQKKKLQEIKDVDNTDYS